MEHLIETPRFYIRELRPDDAAGMFEMDSDPEVHRYIGQRPVQAIGESRAVIDLIRQQYVDHGIGRWAIIDRETDAFIGWTGFKHMVERVNGRIHHRDFGYRLMRKHWGKGIATETGRAALHYGIRTLGLKDIYAMTDVHNSASRHVLEKLGFRFVEIFDWDGPPTWRTEADRTATWYELP